MARQASALILAVFFQLLLLQSAWACVYLYGARHEVPHYSYGYVGLDWPEEYAACMGTRQSPIHIPGHSGFAKVPDAEESRFGYGSVASDGSNIKVVNNGHTVQVVFPTGYAPNASVVARGDNSAAKLVTKFNTTSTNTQRVKLSPAQFHFHTRSEHVIDGKEYAMEMHIVNWVYAPALPACGVGGCATVVGIMLELAEDPEAASNEFINTIWDVMPTVESTTAYIPSGKALDFDAILPADMSYVTFEGSLTTPPCTEGILWHVLTTPMKITRAQLHKFELAVGATNCSAGAPASRRHLLTTDGTGHAETGFQVPEFVADSEDGMQCRKLSGQNYREVQDRNARPILFHAAPGLCDAQLNILQSRSKVLRKLIFEANTTTDITLHQYGDMVEAGLTQAAGCAGIASRAQPTKGPGSALLQMLLAAFLLSWLL